MNINQKYDKVLLHLEYGKQYQYKELYESVFGAITNEKDVHLLFDSMADQGLILKIKLGPAIERTFYKLTVKGQDVIQVGGWKKFKKMSEPSGLDRAIKYIALIESVVIIIGAIYTISVTSDVKDLKQVNMTLVKDLSSEKENTAKLMHERDSINQLLLKSNAKKDSLVTVLNRFNSTSYKKQKVRK